MELLSSMTDDQKALLGCVLALLLCGGLLSLSGLLGRSARENDLEQADESDTIRLPDSTANDTTISTSVRSPQKAA